MTHRDGAYLLAAGYVPASETRTRLQEFATAGVIMTRLAAGIGWHPESVKKVASGRNRYVPGHVADAVLTLTVDQALRDYGPTPARLDPVTLELLLADRTVTVASQDKPVIAAALHSKGWSKTRISRTLAMSGTKVNQALGQVST
ncbi:hypothetical protein ACFWU5_16840 [Nocardia sp. NPDC058640]|uniref:hypothetical protein n=1 Tax=Nocardia sp. NPDC058640 TaxID=3346571 RepID=UPI00364C64E8